MTSSWVYAFDAAGQVRTRLPLKVQHISFGMGAELWRPADLDGDLTEELLYTQDGQWCAAGGDDLKLLWSRAFELKVMEGHPVNRQTQVEMAPGLLAMWSGFSVFGLNATNGHCVWRTELPQQPQWGASPSTSFGVLQAGHGSTLPRIVLQGGSRSVQSWGAPSRQTWPTSPDGRYTLPTPKPRSYAGLPEAPEK